MPLTPDPSDDPALASDFPTIILEEDRDNDESMFDEQLDVGDSASVLPDERWNFSHVSSQCPYLVKIGVEFHASWDEEEYYSIESSGCVISPLTSPQKRMLLTAGHVVRKPGVILVRLVAH